MAKKAASLDVVDIPHHHIDPDPDNPNRMPDSQLRALREEIKERGFVQPVLVRLVDPDPENPRYRIVDGEHRWRILGELGMETVPCVIEDGDETDAQIRMLTMNRLRGRFVPIKLAYLLADLAETVPESELQRRLALDSGELRNYLDLAGYMNPPEPPHPSGNKERDLDNSVEVVVVATREQATQINELLDELTEGDEDALASTLARVAREYVA